MYTSYYPSNPPTLDRVRNCTVICLFSIYSYFHFIHHFSHRLTANFRRTFRRVISYNVQPIRAFKLHHWERRTKNLGQWRISRCVILPTARRANALCTCSWKQLTDILGRDVSLPPTFPSTQTMRGCCNEVIRVPAFIIGISCRAIIARAAKLQPLAVPRRLLPTSQFPMTWFTYQVQQAKK